ncbi:MAG: AAA family ATPase, partial [Rikenellaceae bacterium]|nr:AAA family ATPase [Rikenellaceae bacterium]
DAGTIAVEGVDVAQRGTALYTSLMIVPEEFGLPQLTLDRFVKVTAPFYPNYDQARFDDCCSRFEVNRAVRLDRMSMGQRKKAYLAFALACNTPVLLLDEPTNGLDIPARQALRQMLAEQVNDDRTIIISTHAARDIENLVDRLVILEPHRMVLNESIATLSTLFGVGVVPAGVKPLYSEPSVVGVRGVWVAEGDEESRMDMEMMFNAATKSPREVAAVIANHSKL